MQPSLGDILQCITSRFWRVEMFCEPCRCRHRKGAPKIKIDSEDGARADIRAWRDEEAKQISVCSGVNVVTPW